MIGTTIIITTVPQKTVMPRVWAAMLTGIIVGHAKMGERRSDAGEAGKQAEKGFGSKYGLEIAHAVATV